MTNTQQTTILFDLDNLPTDHATLRAIRDAVSAKLGETSVTDISAELESHLKTALDLRDELIEAVHPDTPQSAAAAVSAVRAFTDVLARIVDIRDKATSQQAYQVFLEEVVEVLSEVDMELRREVVTRLRQRLTELNS